MNNDRDTYRVTIYTTGNTFVLDLDNDDAEAAQSLLQLMTTNNTVEFKLDNDGKIFIRAPMVEAIKTEPISRKIDTELVISYNVDDA